MAFFIWLGWRDLVTDNLPCKFPRPRLAWLRSQSRLRPCAVQTCTAHPQGGSSPNLGQIKNRPRGSDFNLAGMEGLEPPNAGTKNQCLTTWRHPITMR